jgi:hypothetical protein
MQRRLLVSPLRNFCYNADMVANAVSTILERVFEPGTPNLPPEAARSFLQIRFSDADTARMTTLATKGRQGGLTAEERDELEGYLQVGMLIDLLQSKARISLAADHPVA